LLNALTKRVDFVIASAEENKDKIIMNAVPMPQSNLDFLFIGNCIAIVNRLFLGLKNSASGAGYFVW
jgi:hypothetical protein